MAAKAQKAASVGTSNKTSKRNDVLPPPFGGGIIFHAMTYPGDISLIFYVAWVLAMPVIRLVPEPHPLRVALFYQDIINQRVPLRIFSV
jgi:hypothetical protein